MSDKNVEAVYKLSPMQQGMLVQTLVNPWAGVYVQQLCCTLNGALNVAAFKRAWQRVVERHPVLRTAFYWEQHSTPLQVVYRRLRLDWQHHDWRSVPASEHQARLDEILRADQERGFNPSVAPLMRWTLIQVSDEQMFFIWSYHHLVLDGWCQGQLFRELLAFYESFRQGRDLQLPPVRPYRDYIGWLLKQDQAAAESFWRQALAGVTSPTPLPLARPTDHATPVGDRYVEQQITLPAATSAALQRLARQHQLTLNTLVQGAWSLLLSRYSGAHDVVFGATVSGRPPELDGVEQMIGLFINTLPMRVQVQPERQLLPWLKEVQDAQVRLRRYEYSSLMQVQGWSDVQRGMPLFESIVVFENVPIDESVAAGQHAPSLTIGDLQFARQIHFPLSLVVVPSSEIGLALNYDCQRFDQQTIATLLDQLQTVLASFASAPEQRLGDISLLNAAERQQVLRDWNATASDWQPDQFVHELFAAQAAQTPDAIALTFEEQQLTYAQLNQRADRLAARLRAVGVGPETLVGLYLERSLDLVVALLGILKAGGAYLPLDPSFPADRIAFMLADADVNVLLTQSTLGAEIPHSVPTILCLDDESAAIGEEAPSATTRLDPEHLAYQIYTSGSTGTPKGVAIPHRALTNFLLALRQESIVTSGDTLAAVTTLSFDIAGLELFLPLICGARILLLPQSIAADGIQLAAQLAAADVTAMQATPATWQMLLASGWSGSSRLKILCGGEPLPEPLARQLQRRSAGLWNLYGPTETTIWSTMSRVEAGPITIGRPIANTQMYILDQRLRPVPIGAPGDLYIGGAGLARGYHQRPALTAERFLPDPFSAAPGARMYNTGDVARYSADGTIAHLGRSDHQVKVRGYRIELGEIEAALQNHPAVREAVVVAREDTPGNARLVAYLVKNQERGSLWDTKNQDDESDGSKFSVPGASDLSSPQELRRFLRATLPGYMIPAAFVVLEALPLTPSGKVDRKALPAPEQSRPELDRPFVAPRTETEQRIAAIWADQLKLERVGVYDNFFDLGGHSLIALQVLARLRETFQLKLPLRYLFEAPTVAQLAATIEIAREMGVESAANAFAEVDLRAEIALDPAISAAGLSPAAQAEPRSVLLTGATGFLGAFLLAELLDQTRAAVHCLVRAADAEAGMQKIQRNLESYQVWKPDFAARIVPVVGDLAQPLLGLSAAQFGALAQTIDAIYHNGALVNFAYPYSVLKAPNVQGTVEILRLATTGTLKPVHFVSTSSVFHAAGRSATELMHEDDPLEQYMGLPTGYAESKWVAERILMLARERGIPIAIYRPGPIAWDSRTGAWNTNDVVYKAIKGCIQLGLAPEIEHQVEITPVDYVSQAIVALSLRPDAVGRAFHLVNFQLVPWTTLIEWLNAEGCAVRRLPYAEWYAALSSVANDPDRSALYPLVALATEEAFQGQTTTEYVALRFDLTQTEAGLAGTGIRCPEPGPTLLGPLLKQLQSEALDVV